MIVQLDKLISLIDELPLSLQTKLLSYLVRKLKHIIVKEIKYSKSYAYITLPKTFLAKAGMSIGCRVDVKLDSNSILVVKTENGRYRISRSGSSGRIIIPSWVQDVYKTCREVVVLVEDSGVIRLEPVC